MSRFSILAAICLAAFSTAASAQDKKPRCREVSGEGLWAVVPAPNDPLGRVAGPVTGSLKGAVTAYLTTLVPGPAGIAADSVEVWVMDDEGKPKKAPAIGAPQNTIVFNGKAVFVPIPLQPEGTVTDNLTLTVAAGTGIYAGATGKIEVKGTGYNLFGPNAGPGSTHFRIEYKGEICRVN